MKAIILAAGKGTRVRPITYAMPKPMVPIINKPVLELLVEHLALHDARQIMVNTSYRAGDIENYFRDGSRFGVEMAYSFEGRLEGDEMIDCPVGSAGALKKIQEHSGFFDETFVVLCGDAIVDIDLTRLVEIHKEHDALATIALTHVEREEVSNYGVVVMDAHGRIEEFQEKPTVEEARSTTVNTGIYVFEPEVIDYIPSGEVYDIGSQLFPALVADHARLFGSALPFQWLDIGKVNDFYSVIQSALRGEIHEVKIPGSRIADGVWAGLNVSIDLDKCNIKPPVYIGGSSTIEDGCTIIGPTMIGPGCVIESDAHIEQSVIFDYTRIGSYAEIKEMMVSGQYCADSSGTTLEVNRENIGWIISDSRIPKQMLTREQLDLQNVMREVEEIEAAGEHKPRLIR